MTIELAEEQQHLHDFAASSHPQWWAGHQVTREMLIGFAVLFDRARRQIDHYFDMTFITRATEGGASDPDWLDGLARELGSYRFAGETDEALRDRLRSVPAVITRPQILLRVAELLAGAGFDFEGVTMEEIPRQAGYCLSTPAVLSDAAGHAFAFTPALDALASRVSSNKPFGFVLIVPASVSDEFLVTLRVLLDEIRAAGYASLVERFA